jgi:hypothetical protein
MRYDISLLCVIILFTVLMILFPSTFHARDFFGIATLIVYFVIRVIRRIVGGRTANTNNNEREASWLNFADVLAFILLLGGFLVLVYINNR